MTVLALRARWIVVSNAPTDLSSYVTDSRAVESDGWRHLLSVGYNEMAERTIPGGAHTYAKGSDQYPAGLAPVIDRGAGCRVWDLDGNEYLEYGSGLRSVTLGHSHPAVLEAVKRTLDLGVNFVRPHRLELTAATRLLELFPHAEMVKFGLNGSDVTNAALRLARAHTGRDLVAVCGDHPIFSTGDWFIGTTQMAAGVPPRVRELTLSFRYNDLDSVRRLLEANRSKVAAIVLEAETSVPPAPGFLPGLRELCDEHGVVLILDEIITGFRWHLRGAQYVHGIRPDLCTFGKGLSNGLPLSALVGRREIMELGGFSKDRDRVWLLSQTYGAQPWALAAMIAVIDVYEQEDVAGQLHATGAKLRLGCESAIRARGLQKHVQIAGRDCNLIFSTRDADGRRSQGFRTLFLQELLARGVLAPSFVVNLAHDDEAIELTIEVVRQSLSAYEQALEHGLDGILNGRPVQPSIRRRG
jgi:glutamate-1-semialdehyde 2,1-aminomutase